MKKQEANPGNTSGRTIRKDLQRMEGYWRWRGVGLPQVETLEKAHPLKQVGYGEIDQLLQIT